jgi:hypothetical protein
VPRYSGVTFAVQPVEVDDEMSGYVISGFLSTEQLAELRSLVDS